MEFVLDPCHLLVCQGETFSINQAFDGCYLVSNYKIFVTSTEINGVEV